MSARRLIWVDLGGLSRWQRFALVGWALVLLCICTKSWLAPGSHNVYLIFANAARNWLQGAPLYGVPPKGLDIFRYSPAVAGFFVPLGLLPDGLASALWRALSAVLSLLALTWWGRATLPASAGPHRQVLLWLLVFPACLANLNNGQTNPLVLALILAAVAGAAEQRWNLAAVCVALATLFKVYPLALGLLLAVAYPRRFASRLCLAVLAGLALPLLMQAPGYAAAQYAGWVHLLRVDHRGAAALECAPRDLWLLCRVWGVQLPAGVYPALQLLTALGAAGLCVAARRRGWSRRRLLALLTGLGCCWMTVLGPATESSTYLLLGPPLAAALLETWNGGRPHRTFWGFAVAFALLLLTYCAAWFPAGKDLSKLAFQPLAGMLTFGCLVSDALQALLSGRPADVDLGEAHELGSA